MKVGVIAEGQDDCGVLFNILVNLLPIESAEDIKFIRPDVDATDGALASFSNWPMVKHECIKKEELDKFLVTNSEAELLIIIQIDTAECEETQYDVVRPTKSSSNLKLYSEELRNNVIEKIKKWLGEDFKYPVAYAVAIEETEAWVIALLDGGLRRDSCQSMDPKARLNSNLSSYITRSKLKTYIGYKSGQSALKASQYLSKDFQISKPLKSARNKNRSLDLFCLDLEAYVHSV